MEPEQLTDGTEQKSTSNVGNKLMSLEDARLELERQGMSCDFINDRLLVGYLSECRWVLTAKIDVLVFVHKVTGTLHFDRVLADMEAVPTLVDELSVGGKCPPFGFSRGRQIMIVYYADTIAQEAVYEIVHRTPKREFCSATFLVAQDSQGQSYYLAEDKTPFWGRAFYPELRFRAGKLTGRPIDENQPPGLSCWLKFVNIFTIVYLIIAVYFMPGLLLLLGGMLLLHFLIAVAVQWYGNRKRRSSGVGLIQEIGGGGDSDGKCHMV